MCDPREQTGRGSPAGRGGSKWQSKTRCGVFVPREHNLAPFCFRPREPAARSTPAVERCGIPGSQSRQRGGVPVPANGRRFMSRQGGERAAFGPNESGLVVVQPRAAGNRWKVVGSSLGSLKRNKWRCHGRWFLRRFEDNGTRRRFVSTWGAIALSCWSLRRWAGDRDMYEKSPRIR